MHAPDQPAVAVGVAAALIIGEPAGTVVDQLFQGLGGLFVVGLGDAGGAAHDMGEVVDGVELEPLDDAETIAQWRGQQPGPRGCADQRERRQIELDGARSGALADHDVQLIILQRRVEDFFDDRTQAVDLVDEQDVARFEIGQ